MKLSLSRKCIHFPIHPLKSKKYCILFLIFSYFSGIGAGFLKEQIFAFSNESTSARPSPVNQNSVTSIPRTISCALPDLTLSSEGNWGLSFQEEGKTPVGNASIQELASMDAYYAQDTSEKVLYLTFDAGYENGNTPAILDALKKHQVKATFFVVGTYIDSEPELIRQIIKEGHTVGNHTWHHPDMSHISSIEDFLDLKVNYYAKTNFSGITNIIDALGGVTIDSPYEFTTLHGHYHINKGINQMDGDKALCFVRERYNLPSGDYDRGRNQQKLLKAMLNKAMSPKIITNFQRILTAIEGCFETNMSSDEIKSLINMQLDDNAEWDVFNVQLDGKGYMTDQTYSMHGTSIYVMKPYTSYVKKITKLIDCVENGDKITENDVKDLGGE